MNIKSDTKNIYCLRSENPRRNLLRSNASQHHPEVLLTLEVSTINSAMGSEHLANTSISSYIQGSFAKLNVIIMFHQPTRLPVFVSEKLFCTTSCDIIFLNMSKHSHLFNGPETATSYLVPYSLGARRYWVPLVVSSNAQLWGWEWQSHREVATWTRLVSTLKQARLGEKPQSS